MKIKDIVNRDIVNLQNCDQEPIHIPGSIQPHGFLIAINKDNCHISFCSGNAIDFLGVSYQQLLGRHIEEIFGDNFCAVIMECVAYPPGRNKEFKTTFNGKVLDFAAHMSGDNIILESEAGEAHNEQLDDIFALSQQFLAYMEDTQTLRQLCGEVAKGIRNITGYDRVMIYRFDKDYNGEVIAEQKREDLEPFLGLHYPHTDIPAQARELYIKNLLRIIVDINYTPVPLYTIDDGASSNLDLSYSVLRSVSPIHVQYLHNMGVGATLTISLLHKKKLWGLVACHHYSPKYLSQEVRVAAKLQGHFITSQIDVRQTNEEYELSRKASQSAEELISRKFDLDRNSFSVIVSDPNILRLCDATGVSIVLEGRIYKNGHTPSDEEIVKLVGLVFETGKNNFHTDSIQVSFPGFECCAGKIAGFNFFTLDKESRSCIIWYRNETVSEVNWAGDPAKAIEKDKNGLSPRKSFELWKQRVQFQSRPWMKSELDISYNFGNVIQKHIISVFLAEEEEKQRQLARQLSETNDELENINWISTHDLQEPLRKIQMMSSFLMSDKNSGMSMAMHEKLERMNASAARMQTLITDILKYTRLRKNESVFEKIDLNVLMSEVLEEIAESLKEKKAKVKMEPLPVIKGVPFLLKQLFSNLLFNSLKFSDPNRSPEIQISASEVVSDGERYYRIEFRDNGIGFEGQYNESIFNIFSRLHSTSEYSGSGIGLALCKKIMSTHKGAIKAQGKPDVGAVFFVDFPVTLNAPAQKIQQ